MASAPSACSELCACGSQIAIASTSPRFSAAGMSGSGTATAVTSASASPAVRAIFDRK